MAAAEQEAERKPGNSWSGSGWRVEGRIMAMDQEGISKGMLDHRRGEGARVAMALGGLGRQETWILGTEASRSRKVGAKEATLPSGRRCRPWVALRLCTVGARSRRDAGGGGAGWMDGAYRRRAKRRPRKGRRRTGRWATHPPEAGKR